ncbi:MAG: hypothetical protein KJ749_10670 [Planctomycetes bacterium]|nr:hypothetical protein [Planctomycetota bacterium]
MAILVHRFDDRDLFPILTTFSTADVRADSRVEGRREDVGLHLSWTRQPSDPAEVMVAIGLPLRGIGGEVQRLDLELDGDLRSCRVILVATDSCGAEFYYHLQSSAKRGRHTWSGDGRHARTREDEPGNDVVVSPPIQPQRLSIVVGPERRTLEVRLLCLRATGDARLVPSGIANGNKAGSDAAPP